MQPQGQSPLGPLPPGWIGAGPIDNPFNPVAPPSSAPKLPGGGGTVSIIPVAPHAPMSSAPVPAPPPAINTPQGGSSQQPGLGSSPYDSDPGYQAALAAQQLGVGNINGNLQSLIAQRIANYGDPHLAEMAGFGLDPQAAAFARQNYLSGNAELARIDKSHQLARQAIINRLAGHGLVFSGDTGYQTGLEDQSYGNNVYDAQQKALADILGYRTNALDQEQQLRQSVVDALQTAYGNYLNHPELYGYGQASPSTPSGGNPTPGSIGSSQPPKKTSTKAAVVKQLTNPYTTGQKKRG